MITPPDNRYLRRSSVSVPREQRTAWQIFRLVLECVFVVVLLMGIAASIYAIYQRLSQQNFFPLKRVIIQEPLRYGDMREVSEIIRNHHQRDLLHMDVTLLADEMQRLDWIAKASVYKRWPDAVEVKLEERVPVVRWGGRAFLDASGTAFSIPDNDKLRDLATIYGPDGYEKQVLQYWHDIAPWLTARQLKLQQLTLDQRLVWHAELANGLDVILGRDQLNERLKKLVVVNDKVIEPYHRYIEAIDLRYHDGFSVRWKAGVKPVTAEKNPARDGNGIVKAVTVVKEPPAAKETPAKPVAKETAKAPAKLAAPAKEKAAAKAAPKEAAKEKPVAKTAPTEKTATKEPAKEAKEKAASKPAPAAKESGKETKEKPAVKATVAEKAPAKEVIKENKEKTPAKAAPTGKTPEKAAEKVAEKTPAKEKAPAKPAPAEKAPVKEAKEKPVAKTAPAEKTSPKENKEKTANKTAPAAKPAAPKEKDSAKGKK